MNNEKPFFRLSCEVKPAPYGKKGSASTAAQFGTATSPEAGFMIDENEKYCEAHV